MKREAINIQALSAGLVSAIVGCTGPALLIIDIANRAGLSTAQTISWVFACYVGGGILGIILSLKYKQPICGAFSIPGVVLLGTALLQFDYGEAIGAYFAAGVILVVLGLLGLIGKVMEWVPMPIIMAMVAGVLLNFAYDIIIAFEVIPTAAVVVVLVYFIFRRWYPIFPPVLAALVVGIGMIAITDGYNFSNTSLTFSGPIFNKPSFSLDAILAISLPLVVLKLGTENAQAIGVLKANGYEPPINTMTAGSGIGSMIASLFGGHSVVSAGMMTGVCATPDAGPKEFRYGAGVINGVFFGSFGLLASIAVYYASAFPSAFIKLIAGLALINVIDNALRQAFGTQKFRLGAFFSLVIAGSGAVFFNISAPFWALFGGVMVALFIEKDDFDNLTRRKTDFPG